MANFKDGKGREWPVEITVESISRVRTLTGVDLFKIDKPRDPANPKLPLFSELASDIGLLIGVVFALVKPTSEARSIQEADLGAEIGGEALNDITIAFWSSVANFFQRSRPDLAAAARKQMEINKALVKVATDHVEAMDIDAISKNFATSLLASVASTQDPARSAN